MPSFVHYDGKLISKDEYYAIKYMKSAHLQMTVGNMPVVIRYNSDNMDATRHMASGKFFTSKAKFRAETKAYGCIEVGNDVKVASRRPIKLDKRKRREDIKQAISELKNGRKV